MECQRGPNPDHQVSEKYQQRAVPRHLKVFKTSAVAGENSKHAHQHSKVQDMNADGDQATLRYSRPAKPGKKPQRDPQPGLQTKAIEHDVGRGGPHAAISEPRTICQKGWHVKLDRSD